MLPSALSDADLHRALGRLGIDQHTVRAVVLLPLVQVAWADGRVQPAERGLILEVAQRCGLEAHEADVLKQWLARRPTPESFRMARDVLMALWARDRQRGAAPESLDGVLRMCGCVARVAGGLFGLAFTLDRREKELLDELSASLKLGPVLSDAAKEALPDADTMIFHAQDLKDLRPIEPRPPQTHPTLTPIPDRVDAATLPLTSLRPLIDENADTELDLPVLPHPYDAILDEER